MGNWSEIKCDFPDRAAWTINREEDGRSDYLKLQKSADGNRNRECLYFISVSNL
jgi:hypothetical protein